MEQWASAKFMKLDDTSQKDNPGITSECGEECTRHTLTLRAEEDQTVYFTAYTWNDRIIPDQCQIDDNGLYHVAKISALETKFIWNYGQYEIPPFRMTAN